MSQCPCACCSCLSFELPLSTMTVPSLLLFVFQDTAHSPLPGRDSLQIIKPQEQHWLKTKITSRDDFKTRPLAFKKIDDKTFHCNLFKPPPYPLAFISWKSQAPKFISRFLKLSSSVHVSLKVNRLSVQCWPVTCTNFPGSPLYTSFGIIRPMEILALNQRIFFSKWMA